MKMFFKIYKIHFFIFLLVFDVFGKQISLEKDLEFDVSYTSTGQQVWRNVQKKAKDTVVQLFVQTLSFNWLKPYKSPEEAVFYGSGFFISDDGYIVSNFHVIDESVDIKIQIPSFGKKRFDVELVGVCPERDISLLKLTKESLKKIKEDLPKIPYMTFGDSDKILRTQEVLALGYPLGQEKLKSTHGIVSGRERVWDESYIQITAPLNTGSSGGPCLNSNGEVIGINTAAFSKAQNVGYIIPINGVKSVIDDLHKIKFLRTPMLGCEFNFGNEAMIEFLKNPKPGGLYLSRIYKDTLLEKVGIQSGDMLYKLNDHDVDLYGETDVSWSEDKVSILDLLNRYEIGKNMNLFFYSLGEKKEVNFKFDLVKSLPIRKFYTPYEKIDYQIIAGIVVMELALNHIDLLKDYNPYLIKYQKRENQYNPKLIITHIFPNSQAQKSRVLWQGDLIEEINGKKVNTLKDFKESIIKNKDGGFITIKTGDKKFVVFSIKDILNEEQQLAEKNYFKISDLVKSLGEVKQNKNGADQEISTKSKKLKKEEKYKVVVT